MRTELAIITPEELIIDECCNSNEDVTESRIILVSDDVAASSPLQVKTEDSSKMDNNEHLHDEGFQPIRSESLNQDKIQVKEETSQDSIDVNLFVSTELYLPGNSGRKNVCVKVTCYYCGYSSNVIQHLRHHIVFRHPINNTIILPKQLKEEPTIKRKRLSCSYCEYTTAYPSDLKRHTRSRHTGERPFRCTLCDYSATVSGSLISHMRSRHTGERYSCPLCHFKSITKKYLKYHYICKHTNHEKQYKCTYINCTYSSLTYYRLKNHIKAKHTLEKPFKCSFCDYCSVQKGSVDTHIRYKHTGEKPYRCSLCEYTATTSSHLKTHFRAKHTDERPYTCEYCDYCTANKYNLKCHTHKHTRERPFHCQHCDYSSAAPSVLKRHIQRKHIAKS